MILTKEQRLLLSSSLSVFLVGCGSPNYSQSDMHITVEEAKATQRPKPEKIPALVKASPTAPVLSNTDETATFDVVVTSAPVRDLLFALARDAEVNMDVDDNVSGYVTVSALDQTLDAILERISAQVAIRIEKIGDAIVVKADTPYRKYYHVDFPNIDRTYTSSATSGGVGDTGESSISNNAENSFWTSLEDSLQEIIDVAIESEGDQSIVAAQRALQGQEDAEDIGTAEYKPTTDNSFNLNPATGVLMVYAPDRLQKEVQELLDRSLSVAKRQVLLEATIVEVVLNNQYAQGIDWSLFNSLASEGLALYQGGGAGGAAAALEYLTSEVERTRTISYSAANYTSHTATQLEALGFNAAEATALAALSGTARGDAVALALRTRELAELTRDAYANPLNRVTEFESELDQGDGAYTAEVTWTTAEVNEEATARSAGGLKPNNVLDGNFFTAAYRNGDISAAVQLLDTFGDAKVLSSPRISVLNQQPAILRVVDQEVYFNFSVEEEVNEDTGQPTSREYSATENTVDVGFSMNVFPHISDDGEVILNLKPTVTRVLDYRRAPVLESFGSAAGGTQNLVPITRIRELESIISLRDGEIAVLGGLLEDRTGDDSSSVPGLSRLPGVGALFEKRNESTYKTEFVVFIRARIIKDPSVNGDYSGYRHLLPNSDFIIRDTETNILPPAQLKAR